MDVHVELLNLELPQGVEPSEAMEPLEPLEQVERTDLRDERRIAVSGLERLELATVDKNHLHGFSRLGNYLNGHIRN